MSLVSINSMAVGMFSSTTTDVTYYFYLLHRAATLAARYMRIKDDMDYVEKVASLPRDRTQKMIESALGVALTVIMSATVEFARSILVARLNPSDDPVTLHYDRAATVNGRWAARCIRRRPVIFFCYNT
jgi:hypothetical protein